MSANENLLARCVAQDVFFTATDSSLTACQFLTLSNVLAQTKNRVNELEGENVKLREKIQKDDHDNLVKHLSKLEVDIINWQLKYQHLEEKSKTSNLKTSLDAPEFDAYFEINKRDEKIQAHMNTIRKLKLQIAQIKSQTSDMIGPPNPRPLDSQKFQYENTIIKLQKEIECFQIENLNVKQKYNELFDSVKITRDQTNAKTTYLLNEIENLKTQV